MEEPGVAAERSTQVDLLILASEGHRESAKQLLDSTGPIIYGFVYARVGGDQSVAEDIVQSTYLEAVKSAKNFRGDAELSTWLCSIARRQLAQHYKRERKRFALASRLRVISPREEVVEAPHFEDRDEIIRGLSKLSPLHRQILVLKYLDGLSVADLAEELGKSNVQVQSLLQRAREGLKDALEVSDDG